MRLLLVVALLMAPAVEAEPLDVPGLRPLAECDGGVCVMPEARYRELQEFHRRRFQQLVFAQSQLDDADSRIESLEAQVAVLRAKLARYSGGCEMTETGARP